MGNKQSAEYQRLLNTSLPCSQYDAGYTGFVHCDGRCEQAGTVWGSGPYTADSCICRAARHSGALAPTGEGFFKVVAAQGKATFEGTTANGIKSYDFGPNDAAVTFDKVAAG